MAESTHETMVDREIDRSYMQVSDDVAIQITDMNNWYGLDPSRFDAAPLIAFTVTKETNYGTETNGRVFQQPEIRPDQAVPQPDTGALNRRAFNSEGGAG